MKLNDSFFDSISLTLTDGKFFSAQEVFQLLREIRSMAAEDAAESEALRKKLELLTRAQEASVSGVQEMISVLKTQQDAMADTLNAQWQNYLSSLTYFDDEQPEDLSEKVGQIASVIGEIDSSENF